MDKSQAREHSVFWQGGKAQNIPKTRTRENHLTLCLKLLRPQKDAVTQPTKLANCLFVYLAGFYCERRDIKDFGIRLVKSLGAQ